jgi:hypothetical protein
MTQRVQNIDNDNFEAPSKVMQTAVAPCNGSRSIEFNWDSEPGPKDPTPGYIGIMHFSELQLLPTGAVRQFYINLNTKHPRPSRWSTCNRTDQLYEIK